jgi:hypothetical protein
MGSRSRQKKKVKNPEEKEEKMKSQIRTKKEQSE